MADHDVIGWEREYTWSILLGASVLFYKYCLAYEAKNWPSAEQVLDGMDIDNPYQLQDLKAGHDQNGWAESVWFRSPMRRFNITSMPRFICVCTLIPWTCVHDSQHHPWIHSCTSAACYGIRFHQCPLGVILVYQEPMSLRRLMRSWYIHMHVYNPGGQSLVVHMTWSNT